MTMTIERLLAAGRVLTPFPHFGKRGEGCVAQKLGESGISTLDFDGAAGIALYNESGITAHRKTPNGFHIDIRNAYKSPRCKPYGVEVHSGVQAVVVLGTKDGKPYEWLRDPTPYDISDLPPELSQWLVAI